VLTSEQVESYDRDGYLVVPDFVPIDDCKRLRDRAVEIVDAWEPSEQTNKIEFLTVNSSKVAPLPGASSKKRRSIQMAS